MKPPGILGAVTIGQSPRVDVLPEIAELLPGGTRIIERGALDGISGSGLALLAPAPGEELLVTRMRDGREARVSEAGLRPRLQEAVDHVCERGAQVVAVLCTGSLGWIHSPVPLLFPASIVQGIARAAVAGGRLAVVIPAADQVGTARAEWAGAAASIQFLAASPYGPPEVLSQVAAALADWRPDLVVLDCLGFDQRMRYLVSESVRAPVILPRIVLAEAIAAQLKERMVPP